MEKSKVIDDLIKDLRAKKGEARALLAAKDTAAYNSVTNQIRSTEGSLYQMLDCLEGDSSIKGDVFINAIKAYAGVKKASNTDKIILDYMREAAGEDGGFTVPSDIQTQIKELRHDATNLEDLVNIEPVQSNKGSRTYEVRAENSAFAIVNEGDEIPEVSQDDLVEVKYEIKKRAGIIKVTNELLSDTNKAVLTWLKKWLVRKSRATRNKAIIDKANEITAGKEVQVTNADDFKNIFNKTLDVAYSDNAVVLTNASGYDYLDKLNDSNGQPLNLLESDIANKRKLLFGLYPVIRISNSLLPNDTTLNAYPFICGDMEAAITLFDRENMTVDLSSNGSTFFSDVTKIKARDRFDTQAVDKDAIIKAYVLIV